MNTFNLGGMGVLAEPETGLQFGIQAGITVENQYFKDFKV